MAAESNRPSAAARLRVAAVQMKFAPSIEGNLRKIERFAADAARQNADVVLFPECAVTGYAYDFGALRPPPLREALRAVGQIAARTRVNLLVGTPAFRGRKLCNCLVHFDRAGRAAYCYAKCHLTESDRRWFAPGDAVALFAVEGVPATAIICHARRYPELVRLAVMAGSKIVFHPNAGMDSLAVSRAKRGGKDGIAARAFENAVYYAFANSVGPQGGGKFSAGDSKIVAPDERVLQLADNRHEALLLAELDLKQATGTYALRALRRPPFLVGHWQAMLRAVRARAERATGEYDLP